MDPFQSGEALVYQGRENSGAAQIFGDMNIQERMYRDAAIIDAAKKKAEQEKLKAQAKAQDMLTMDIKGWREQDLNEITQKYKDWKEKSAADYIKYKGELPPEVYRRIQGEKEELEWYMKQSEEDQKMFEERMKFNLTADPEKYKKDQGIEALYNAKKMGISKERSEMIANSIFENYIPKDANYFGEKITITPPKKISQSSTIGGISQSQSSANVTLPYAKEQLGIIWDSDNAIRKDVTMVYDADPELQQKYASAKVYFVETQAPLKVKTDEGYKYSETEKAGEEKAKVLITEDSAYKTRKSYDDGSQFDEKVPSIFGMSFLSSTGNPYKISGTTSKYNNPSTGKVENLDNKTVDLDITSVTYDPVAKRDIKVTYKNGKTRTIKKGELMTEQTMKGLQEGKDYTYVWNATGNVFDPDAVDPQAEGLTGSFELGYDEDGKHVNNLDSNLKIKSGYEYLPDGTVLKDGKVLYNARKPVTQTTKKSTNPYDI